MSGAVERRDAVHARSVELHAADLEPGGGAPAPGATSPPASASTGRPLRAAARRTSAAGSTCSCANAPYVPTDAIAPMPPEARDHEPRVALDGGADGLDVPRRVAAEARDWLAPGGSLLIETSAEPGPRAALDALAAAGLARRVVHDEDLYATVVIGLRSPHISMNEQQDAVVAEIAAVIGLAEGGHEQRPVSASPRCGTASGNREIPSTAAPSPTTPPTYRPTSTRSFCVTCGLTAEPETAEIARLACPGHVRQTGSLSAHFADRARTSQGPQTLRSDSRPCEDPPRTMRTAVDVGRP